MASSEGDVFPVGEGVWQVVERDVLPVGGILSETEDKYN